MENAQLHSNTLVTVKYPDFSVINESDIPRPLMTKFSENSSQLLLPFTEYADHHVVKYTDFVTFTVNRQNAVISSLLTLHLVYRKITIYLRITQVTW